MNENIHDITLEGSVTVTNADGTQSEVEMIIDTHIYQSENGKWVIGVVDREYDWYCRVLPEGGFTDVPSFFARLAKEKWEQEEQDSYCRVPSQ